jgi:hypothetical protein
MNSRDEQPSKREKEALKIVDSVYGKALDTTFFFVFSAELSSYDLSP